MNSIIWRNELEYEDYICSCLAMNLSVDNYCLLKQEEGLVDCIDIIFADSNRDTSALSDDGGYLGVPWSS